MSTSYEEFLDSKRQFNTGCGFEPLWMPDYLFDFQKALVEWSVRRGRAAIFADCGLGKGPMACVYAENVARYTNRPVLVMTTLGDSAQMVSEAAKFEVEACRSKDGKFPAGSRIVVTNYERLPYFDPDDFAGAVCNESSILKNAAGKTRQNVTHFMRSMQFRLLCTATAAPNDFDELGNSAEALGELGYQDMITKFFKKGFVGGFRAWSRAKYELKGHAERDFWRWVCSWARAVRRPSDLGFDDTRYILPPLETHEHTVVSRVKRPGFLFDTPPNGLHEEQEERRRTIQERCEKVAELVSVNPNHSLVWCHLNPEGDTLEKLIPGSVQISGRDTDEEKERKIEWFLYGDCQCRGSLSTKKTDEPNSPPTRNTPLESVPTAAGRPKKIRSTCGPITPPTSIDGTGDPQSNEPRSTPLVASDIALTPNSGKSTNCLSEAGTGPRSETAGCEATSGSTPPLTKPCSAIKAEDVLSAGGRTEPSIPGPESSEGCTSTTVTPPGRYEESSAITATSASESSTTTLRDLNGPRCICGSLSPKRVLISKPCVIGLGLNFQHCNHQTFFPSHSFEMYYQAVRRSWRYGQTRPVTIDMVSSEGEAGVLANLQRKSEQADRMFETLVSLMNEALSMERTPYGDVPMEVPSWLTSSVSVTGASSL